MSLRDYTWKYYDIYNEADLNDSINSFLNEKDHDFEVQLIDNDYVGLPDDNLHNFLNSWIDFQMLILKISYIY